MSSDSKKRKVLLFRTTKKHQSCTDLCTPAETHLLTKLSQNAQIGFLLKSVQETRYAELRVAGFERRESRGQD